MRAIESINEWDLPTLRSEWQERADLKAQMIGRLYPSILQGEMIKIQIRENELKFGNLNANEDIY